MSNFKVGDVVKCVDRGIQGVGWKVGRIFTITRITSGFDLERVYWGEPNTSGVFESSIELVNTDWDE